MTPPVLPIAHDELVGIVAKLWPDCARQSIRRHSEWVEVSVLPDGTLYQTWSLASGGACGDHGVADAARALSSLADALEWEHLIEVSRPCGADTRDGPPCRLPAGHDERHRHSGPGLHDGGIRVLGWAAARAVSTDRCEIMQWHASPRHRGGAVWLVPLSRLHPLDDPRRATWEARKRAAREARAEAGRAPPGAPGSLSKGEMARRRAR